MPKVVVRHRTAAELEAVRRVLLDSEAYPTYMPEVVELRIVADHGHHRESAWTVLLKGSQLEWVEREDIDHDAHRIDFEQIEGDLAVYRGHWELSRDAEATISELSVEFDIGIPMMSEMLDPVAARALENNSRLMLEHISSRASQATST